MNHIYILGRVPEEDAEKASYAYLISTVILVGGMIIPLLNMLATFMFYELTASGVILYGFIACNQCCHRS